MQRWDTYRHAFKTFPAFTKAGIDSALLWRWNSLCPSTGKPKQAGVDSFA